MKPEFTDFKITLSSGDATVFRCVTAPRGEHVKKLNEAFIQVVRELEMLKEYGIQLDNQSETEEATVTKPVKGRKTKNAKDNS